MGQVKGVGTDLVSLERFRASLERYGEAFRRRVFTDDELDRVGKGPRTAERLAARFAAKEAVMKLLGTGWGADVAFRDVEVVGGGDERPVLRLTGGAARVAADQGIEELHLSLSHDAGMAVAFVVGCTAS
ncbi:MAG TPA: holo-ACP synthase [Planctomycetes bacterium]|nr:holo-ACP synthase [Planctomycetota bacterium]